MATEKGIDIKAAGRSRPTGANYLLAVAINAYRHHPQLSNCVRDARRLVRVLQEKYGFQPEHTITLFDQEATSANLYARLVELSQKVKPQDNVVIYFSGHGFFDRSDRTGHLVPVEAARGAVWHYFSNANLVNRIRAINSFHTFLIVDSCFSGSLFASKDVESSALAEAVEGLPSRWALAAGQIETVEDGLHGDHSPFAKALLSFLEANASSLVPASELIQHVKRVTPYNARQTPVGGVLFKTGDVGGEFVFRLSAETDEEAAAWQKTTALDTAAAYDDYLDAFPNGSHAGEAEARMEALEQEEEAAWEQAAGLNSLVGYRKYVRAYPQGKYLREARRRIRERKAPADVEVEMPEPAVQDGPSAEQSSPFPEDMIFVEGGAMETGEGENAHPATVSSFHMGACPVTFDEYDAFCENTKRDKPDSQGWGRGRRPVIFVSWHDAVAYCNWRSRQEGRREAYAVEGQEVTPDWNADGYRLPTEAEWEYAARGGQQSSGYEFAGSNILNDVGWYAENSNFRTHEAGGKKANELGLSDLSGNVWEWCWDWYDEAYFLTTSGVRDPRGPASGERRALRGGSWYEQADQCRVAHRESDDPRARTVAQGFRLVLPVEETFTDPRDGQVYRTVELNGRRWLAQNLNFDVGEGCCFYENDPQKGTQYGRLYTWEAANKACPPGWRLPTDEEWRALAVACGGLWDGQDQGDPEKAYAALIKGGGSGLSALLGGQHDNWGTFSFLEQGGRYWSGTEYEIVKAWYYNFSRDTGKLFRQKRDKFYGFSCRCVQEEPPDSTV